MDTALLARCEQLLATGTPARIIVELLLLTRFTETLHAARCELVRQLPAAATIVDLGGASAVAPEGALLNMGYPHSPREITIIDLPPDTRLGADEFSYLSGETTQWQTFGATRVRYLHRSMTDLSGVADAGSDLVWAGQSLEHVTEAEALTTAKEAWRVLRPGGHFCLDTPNRALTRLQFPHSYIHVEHKIEYTAAQLVRLLGEAGFVTVTLRGVCPMPRSARSHVFQSRELTAEAVLSPDPTQAYILYACAHKAET